MKEEKSDNAGNILTTIVLTICKEKKSFHIEIDFNVRMSL